jgi:hypothetical protein
MLMTVVGLGLVALAILSSALDARSGETRLPRRGRGRRSPLRRDEYPFIFWTILVLRVVAAVFLLTILNGWLFEWLR